MSNNYNFSRNALLKRIGLAPANKLTVFLVSLVVVTIPLSYIYNSLAIIFFVLYSILAARMSNVSLRVSLLLPVSLFALMALSLFWTIDIKSSLMALSKEASLLCIPLAFILHRRLPQSSVNNVLKNYTTTMCLIGFYIICRAIFRCVFLGQGIDVFFEDELSINQINIVYLSAFFSLAFFVFIGKKNKTFWGYLAMYFLLIIILLLSSKITIFVNIILIFSYYLFAHGLTRKTRFTSILSSAVIVILIGYTSGLYNKYVYEIQPLKTTQGEESYVTINQAWNNSYFSDKDKFTAISFRVYQARIFKEMITQEPILFTGYGLNASKLKVKQKGIEHNVVHTDKDGNRYSLLNFHNQYIEAFADLGILGFVFTILLVLINLIMAIRSKYFVHIAFAILMISLFLTESFLWRQRGVVFFTLFYCLFNSLLPVNFMDKYVDKTIKKPGVAKA